MTQHVLQNLLNLFPAPAYLEIGVDLGITFHAIEAVTKVAVDPKFGFDERPVRPAGCTVAYHEVPSDTYFGTIITRADRFDVIYLDGLHTFEQTLRDLINAVNFLSPHGVIVIDDVRPNSYPASLPEPADMRATKAFLGMDNDHAWMGDVYKLVFFIDTFFQQFSFATIEDNYGQLVMWRDARSEVPLRDIDFFSRLQFMHCVTEQQAFHLMPFSRILIEVKEAANRMRIV
jgi:hypothetical protein